MESLFKQTIKDRDLSRNYLEKRNKEIIAMSMFVLATRLALLVGAFIT